MKKSPAPGKPKPATTDSDRNEIEILRQKISELVTHSPGKAATVLTDWMKRGAKRIGSRKKSA